MVQRVKMLTAKADDLNSIPRTQTVEGEEQNTSRYPLISKLTVAHLFLCNTHMGKYYYAKNKYNEKC